MDLTVLSNRASVVRSYWAYLRIGCSERQATEQVAAAFRLTHTEVSTIMSESAR